MQAKGAHTVTQSIVVDAFRAPAHQRSEQKGCLSEESDASMSEDSAVRAHTIREVFWVRFPELVHDVQGWVAKGRV